MNIDPNNAPIRTALQPQSIASHLLSGPSRYPVRMDFADRNEANLLFLIVKAVVVLCTVLLIVNGAFPQLQMFITGGSVPVSSALLKALLLSAFLAVGLFRARIRASRIGATIIVFSCYLILNALYLIFVVRMDLSDIVLGYNTDFTILYVIFLALTVPLEISQRTLIFVLTIVAIVCGTLGVAQFITRNPLVPTQSGDGNFMVRVWNEGLTVRVFSLFDEPSICGLFFLFMACLLIALCARRRNRYFAIPLLAGCIFICWISGARTEIAGLGCGIIVALVLTFSKPKPRNRYLPIIPLIGGIVVGSFAYFQSFHAGRTYSVTDTTSFTARLESWRFYSQMINSSTVAGILFGLGFVQNSKIQSFASMLPIDNQYLAVILHIGVLGLLLYLLLFWLLWEEARKRAQVSGSVLHIAVAATFSTFYLLAFFSVAAIPLCAIYLLLAISRTPESIA